MAFQPVPNTAMVEIRATLFGQNIENTLYFEKADGFIRADLNDLAALVRSWWFDEILPTLSVSYVFREVVATDISVAGGEVVFNTASTGTPGGNSDPAEPGNVCIAVSFRTGQAGRSYRGRNYVSGLSTGSVTGNNIEESTRSGLQAGYAALLDVLSDTDFVWGVVSRVTEGLPRPFGVITAVTSVLIIDAFIDSQRRRLSGRGQ